MQCPQCQQVWPDDFRVCPRCVVPLTAETRPPTARAAGGIATAGDGNISVGGGVGGAIVVAGDGATVVIGEQPVTMTSVDPATALGRYLAHVIARNRYLQLQGIRSGGKLVHIELEHIYVTLRATRQRTVSVEEEWLREEAKLAPGEARRRMPDAGGPRVQTETVVVNVQEALAAHPRLVVLGDPGSGKTTLLRYLALLYARDLAEGCCLLRDRLGLAEADAGRLPILLPLRNLGAYLKARRPADDGTEGHALLLDYLREALRNERVDLPPDFFVGYLERGQAAVLLDGLDEVAEADLRRRVARLVEAFTCAYPDCRYVVTSRIVGYTGPARLGENYVTTTVRDFSLADVATFLGHWHRAVAVGLMGPGESAEAYAASQTAQLLAAIQASERIRELAINPLMLTVIALVHRDRVKLPDRRAELYAEAVDVLLGKWDEARGVREEPVLEERPFDTGDRRLMLQAVALHMHEAAQKEIDVHELSRLLGARFQELVGDRRRAWAVVDRFLQVIQERTGLLAEHGQGVYRFSHLTFQEYLAALAVAGRDDYVAYTLAHAADPWWREVILLEAGYLSTQSRERTTRLIRGLMEHPEEPELYHNLVLAAEALRDVGPNRVEGNLEDEIQRRLRAELQRDPAAEIRKLKPPSAWEAWQQRLRGEPAFEARKEALEAQITRRRIAAAQALGRIGGTGFWTLPYGEPEWAAVPAGEFWMGSESAEGFDNERPVHRVHVPAFQIARTPTTNYQYSLFVQATGREAPAHWEGGRPPRGKESHPVVNVSWHDAVAYCRWLSEVTGKSIRLPTEAEWEKAARGGLQIPNPKAQSPTGMTENPQPRREYPWGDQWDPAKCNSDELGLGDTTPVGIFPAGASPYGCLDLAGNVWEWCQSLYQGYPYRADDGREDLAAGGARVVRGGSFNHSSRDVRCAVRDRDYPDIRGRDIGFRVVWASPTSSGL